MKLQNQVECCGFKCFRDNFIDVDDTKNNNMVQSDFVHHGKAPTSRLKCSGGGKAMPAGGCSGGFMALVGTLGKFPPCAMHEVCF